MMLDINNILAEIDERMCETDDDGISEALRSLHDWICSDIDTIEDYSVVWVPKKTPSKPQSR